MPKKNGDELTRIYQGRVLKVTRAGAELPWERISLHCKKAGQ